MRRRYVRPEHETSPEGACLPREGMEAGSEEDPQPKRAKDGEQGVPEGEGLVRREAPVRPEEFIPFTPPACVPR